MRIIPFSFSVQKAAVVSLLLVYLPACSDLSPTAVKPEALPPPAAGVQAMTCQGSLAAKSVRCVPANLTQEGISPAIVGGQDTNVRLSSSNVAYTVEDSIFQFDVAVQNLLPERMGTADGVTPHEEGIRVFFSSGPTATAGSGSATVENPDGRAVFTESDQAFYQYDDILDANEVSSARSWRLQVEPTVETFSFTVHVSTKLQPLIVINEIMTNPAGAVQDSAGEYVELYNAGRWPVNLNGFVVADAETNHTIADSVVVPPGGYALLGRSSNQDRNGGIAPVYLYTANSTSTDLTFSNDGSDFVRLRAPSGVLVDSVGYTDAGIAAAAGSARELIDPSLDNASVDGPNWASATVNYDPSNRGSPGAENRPEVALTAVGVATGLDEPVYLTSPPGDDRLFVVEQTGAVRIIEGGQVLVEPFLDLAPRISSGGERGLLSLAFHPDYATNGYFYVNFTGPDGDTEVERFSVSSEPNQADPQSAHPILTVAQPADNHNGGLIKFGPDGMLYIAMGDGGGGGDPDGNGQNLETLHGSMLRIDVDGGDPYAIPDDNPYAGEGDARAEIWASGLRNPWRFSFDHTAGLLYVGDVGQNRLEEINVVPASQAGVNYGWNTMEGSTCYEPSTGCNTTGLTLPVHEYPTSDGCSVTGGYVYRGTAMPELRGTYFYADYCSGQVSSFRYSNGTAVEIRDWDLGDLGNISSFGEDADGELYIVDRGGDVYRLERP